MWKQLGQMQACMLQLKRAMPSCWNRKVRKINFTLTNKISNIECCLDIMAICFHNLYFWPNLMRKILVLANWHFKLNFFNFKGDQTFTWNETVQITTGSVTSKLHSTTLDKQCILIILYKHIISTTDRRHRQTLIQHMIQINSTITYKHINNYFPLQKSI